MSTVPSNVDGQVRDHRPCWGSWFVPGIVTVPRVTYSVKNHLSYVKTSTVSRRLLCIESSVESRRPDPLQCVRTLMKTSSLSLFTSNVGCRTVESRDGILFPLLLKVMDRTLTPLRVLGLKRKVLSPSLQLEHGLRNRIVTWHDLFSYSVVNRRSCWDVQTFFFVLGLWRGVPFSLSSSYTCKYFIKALYMF